MTRFKVKRTAAKALVIIAVSISMTGCVAAVGAAMAGSAAVNWAAMDPGRVPNYEGAKVQAEDAIRQVLKDPDSAHFRNPTPFFKTLYNFGLASIGNKEPLWALCFEVNAKNSYGGYTGFQNWIVKFRNGQPVRGDLGVMRAEHDCETGPAQANRRAG